MFALDVEDVQEKALVLRQLTVLMTAVDKKEKGEIYYERRIKRNKKSWGRR